MVRHGGSSAGSYLVDPTFPIPSHCAESILLRSVPAHQLPSLVLEFIMAEIQSKEPLTRLVGIQMCLRNRLQSAQRSWGNIECKLP